MTWKLFFILLGYFILSVGWVESYVLFAANIDDFRSLANKIIPGQLAEQLANMASKRENLNYRQDANDGVTDESNDDSSKDDNTDDSSEDSNYSGSFYRTEGPSAKEKSSKKKYVLQNEKIDLDELVKRVKERLENDYKVTASVKNEANNISGLVMTTDKEEIGRIEDYYYKDDNMNEDFNKNTENFNNNVSSAFTTEPNEYEIVQDYEGVNIDYNEEDQNEGQDYAGDNVEAEYYVQENVNQNDNYNTVTEKQQQSHVATLKKIVRYGHAGQEVQKFDEYGNVISKQVKYSVKINENNPSTTEYYKENEPQPLSPSRRPPPPRRPLSPPSRGRPQIQSNVYNPKEINIEQAVPLDLKETPEYYDDTANDTQIEPVGPNGDLFKEVDMLKPSNDSYEDYVTPKRDDIFESAETVTQKAIKPVQSENKPLSDNTILKLHHKRPKSFVEPHDTADKVKNEVITPPALLMTPQPEFIRAKTASMWYKDPNIENYDDSTRRMKAVDNMRTTKKRLRTMFPTKMHIKISSPNYFAKLPAVAEKYNFDEPIPEKDREPERIKDIGNPPAMINKKIKI